MFHIFILLFLIHILLIIIIMFDDHMIIVYFVRIILFLLIIVLIVLLFVRSFIIFVGNVCLIVKVIVGVRCIMCGILIWLVMNIINS